MDNPIACETVLILEGGDSLGSYEYGVYKTLVKNNITFDIIAGTSIGAINPSIISSSDGGEEAAKKFEDFWLELAEKTNPSFLPDNLREYYSSMSDAYGEIQKHLSLNLAFQILGIWLIPSHISLT
jgi:NTE family protein